MHGQPVKSRTPARASVRWAWLLLVAAAVALASLRGPAVLLAREPLVIRVSPSIAQPPAFVTVRTDVEADDDNRALEVSAEGDDFFTSSRLPLDGSKAPRFNEFHFDNLPAGSYKVKVVLVGSMGPRATVSRPVTVGTPEDNPSIGAGADNP